MDLNTLILGHGAGSTVPALAAEYPYLSIAWALMGATLSGLLLAFHPVYRGRPLTLERIDQRKTILLYASVGAIIAIVCTAAPAMAFVIFGIGGLMRFRTMTGESTVTGQTIMSTLIGLCWGLGLQLMAAVATLYFWGMIYALEATRVFTLTVGIDATLMARSAALYRRALGDVGCRVLSITKTFSKHQMQLVVRVPRRTDMNQVQRALSLVPQECQGLVDWPSP
jgi:hypothetical protein